jgi:predicted ArsR family transcriptional regulator
MTAGAMVTAMRGMRGEILISLKQAQPLTTKELAKRFGVTPNALRRYLKELEDGGFVRYERVARGVGGPSFAYTLTEVADELFPDDYPAVLADALSALRANGGSGAVRDVFEQRWHELVEPRRPMLDALAPKNRARAVAALLTDAGYMAEWQDAVDGGTLIARHCAVRTAAERFPEACEAEARVLAALLGATVERRACIAGGCSACEYQVRFEAGRPTAKHRVGLTRMDEERA